MGKNHASQYANFGSLLNLTSNQLNLLTDKIEETLLTGCPPF